MAFAGTARFDVIRLLGRGGMGSVYEVLDRKYGRHVALKTLNRLTGESLYRFKREFRALADLRHLNLIELHELLADKERWFFTMELIEGQSFIEHVRPSGASPCGVLPRCAPALAGPEERTDLIPSVAGPAATANPRSSEGCGQCTEQSRATQPAILRAKDRAQPQCTALVEDALPAPAHRLSEDAPLGYDRRGLCAALLQLCAGLQALHETGKVHRDIKPSNILVTSDARVVLLDFGLVRELATGSSQTDLSIAGTPSYMAPEQASQDSAVGPSADWYAVGTVLYQALTGRLPYEGKVLQILQRKQLYPPEHPMSIVPQVDRDLAYLSVELLSIRPEHRPTGEQVLERVEELACRLGGQVERRQPAVHMRPVWVGRETELGLLQQAYDRAAAGQTTAVQVVGGAGIGKTALVDRFVDALEASNPGRALVLRGRCYERETVPYKAFDAIVDRISHEICMLPKSEQVFVVPHAIGYLRAVFPVLDRIGITLDPRYRSPEHLDPGELQSGAFAACHKLLVKLSRLRPIVAIIDDLQWADRDSLQLLLWLLQQQTQPEIMWAVTYRPKTQQDSSLRDVAQALSDVAGGVRLDLDPLSPDDTRELAQQLLQGEHACRDTLREEISKCAAEEARGNPFYVNELVRYGVSTSHRESLLEERAADRSSRRLEKLIVQRMKELPAQAQLFLKLAAVAGDPTSEAILATAGGVTCSAEVWTSSLAVLKREQLLRGQPSGPEAYDVEPYHDLTRESVLRDLDTREQQDLHGRLASVMLQEDCSPADRVARHLLGAGRRDDAYLYVRDAAAQAMAKLAFDRASQLYGLALELTPDETERPMLQQALGRALANSGRPRRAAEAYLGAADGADPREALELHRLAADQLLRGGYVSWGLEVVEKVLSELGLRLARSPQRAAAAMVRRLVWLRLSGLKIVERDTSSLSDAERRTLDVLWAVSVGLSVVDSIRADDFLLRFLLRARKAGDLDRFAAGLSLLCAHLAALGGRFRRQAVELISEAEVQARRSGEARTVGLAVMSRGIVKYFTVQFRAAVRDLSEAEGIFMEKCHGVSWELATTRSFLCFALRLHGQLKELGTRYDRHTADAIRVGDLYTATNLHTYCSIALLARDEPARALRDLQRAGAGLSEDGYHVQHFFYLYGRCELALYQGCPERAWAALEEETPRLEASLLSKVAGIRNELANIRGRTALALAAERTNAGSYLDEAERCVRRLQREPSAIAKGWGAAIDAGVYWLRDRPSARKIERKLRHAIGRLEVAESELLVNGLRRRMGHIVGGAKGAAMVTEANAWLDCQGVKAPKKLVRLIAPGLGPPEEVA